MNIYETMRPSSFYDPETRLAKLAGLNKKCCLKFRQNKAHAKTTMLQLRHERSRKILSALILFSRSRTVCGSNVIICSHNSILAASGPQKHRIIA